MRCGRLRSKKTKGSKENQEESSSSSSQMKRSSSFSKRSLDKRCSSINEERNITHQSSSDKRLYLDDDDEIESFLRSLNKRGRGSVGPRMDETVPYLPTEKVDQLQSSDTRERKRVSPRRMGSVGEVSGGGFKCGSDDLRGCEQNDGVMGGKKLFQQEDLLVLRPSSCSACLLQ